MSPVETCPFCGLQYTQDSLRKQIQYLIKGQTIDKTKVLILGKYKSEPYIRHRRENNKCYVTTY